MGGCGGRPSFFEFSTQSAFSQAVNILFYVTVCGMVKAFEPFPFQNYGKLPLAFRQPGY